MTGSRKGAKAQKGTGKKAKRARSLEKINDGRYVIIDGRRWRATNPNLSEDERQRLVNELMKARRDVGKALREHDEEAELEARGRVNRAKIALGERGPKWWLKSSDIEEER